MSRYLLPALQELTPYVAGEQPATEVVKLNTNESPYPPSPRVLRAAKEAVDHLHLYPDAGAKALRLSIAKHYGLRPENIFTANGSDEVLGFSFLAFADGDHPITMPDISYAFYPVYAKLFRVSPRIIPLNEDLTLPVDKFMNVGTMVVFANPNAPTTLPITIDEVEKIVKSNPDHVVLVDEAYVDFGGQTALPLLDRYDNLLIVRTFSKSRALAGARLGYAMGHPALIADLEKVRNSFHPYNVNRVTMAAGIEAMEDVAYFEECTKKIIAQREETIAELRALGFVVPQSATNFVYVKHPKLSGQAYYEGLRERGIITRYWNVERIADYVRISIGTRMQMRKMMLATRAILASVKE